MHQAVYVGLYYHAHLYRLIWEENITVAFSQQHTHNTRWDVTLEICSVWPSDFPFSYYPFRIPFIFHFFYFKAPKLTLSVFVGGGGLHRWFIVPCWEMCGALLTIHKTWSKWRLSGIAPYLHVPGEEDPLHNYTATEMSLKCIRHNSSELKKSHIRLKLQISVTHPENAQQTSTQRLPLNKTCWNHIVLKYLIWDRN